MQDSELNPNQKRALAALLTQPSVAAAAKACGLAERTLYHYLAQPTFKAELRQRQDKVLAATTAALVGLSGEAVTALSEVLSNPTATDAVKVRAALGWLRHARESVELSALAERVTVLETKILSGGAK